MTNNIAHELKTPVSSIRGYIETLLEQPNITPDKQHFFLERTYSQIVRLSDLIRDIALITKTEEASELFDKERVNVHNTLQEVIDDLHDPIIAHGINVKNRNKSPDWLSREIKRWFMLYSGISLKIPSITPETISRSG